MKKLILFLLLGGSAWAQDPSGIQFLPGSCQTTLNRTCQLFRMPDTINAYTSGTTDNFGIYIFNIKLPGVYRQKLTVGAQAYWTNKFSYIPIVPVGGDSTVDVASTIQRSIDSLPSTGGIVYLPPGVHLIGSTITINKSCVQLVGCGIDATILKIKNSSNVYAITISNGKSDIIIRDLSINGNRTNQSGSAGGFNINGATIKRVKIQNVKIFNTWTHGMVFANGASDCDITSCIFDSIGTVGNTNSSEAMGIYIISSCKDIRITGCTFTAWSGTGAVRINNNCQRIQAYSCIFRNADIVGNADRRAIFADNGVDGHCTDLQFIGNQVFNTDENAIFVNICDRTVISNNQVDSIGNNGLEINGTDAVISNNFVKRCRNIGISMNNCNGGTVTGNEVKQCWTRGIYLFSALHDSMVGITVTGNTCINNSQNPTNTNAGIDVLAEDSTGATADGHCRRITIIGNSCYDTQASKTQKYGISTGNDVDYYTIVGNVVTPNATSGLSDAATPAANKYVPAGGNP